MRWCSECHQIITETTFPTKWWWSGWCGGKSYWHAKCLPKSENSEQMANLSISGQFLTQEPYNTNDKTSKTFDCTRSLGHSHTRGDKRKGMEVDFCKALCQRLHKKQRVTTPHLNTTKQ